MKVRAATRLLVALAVVAAVVFAVRPQQAPTDPRVIAGPYELLLAASTDLGPSQAPVRLTAELRTDTPPAALTDWASGRGLSVHWRTGDRWAVIAGTAPAMAAAFNLTVHDYRGRRGQRFYASPQQPQVPEPLRTEVSELGRILSFTPFHDARPVPIPLDVSDHGLSPKRCDAPTTSSR